MDSRGLEFAPFARTGGPGMGQEKTRIRKRKAAATKAAARLTVAVGSVRLEAEYWAGCDFQVVACTIAE